MRGIYSLQIIFGLVALVVLTAAPCIAMAHGDNAVGVITFDAYQSGAKTHLLFGNKAQRGPIEVFYKYSLDGRTWSRQVCVSSGLRTPANPRRGNDIQIAAHGNNLVAVWWIKGTDPWGGGPLYTAISSDGGKSWRPGAGISDEGSTTGHAFVDIVADTDGVFHAVWLDSRDGKQGLRYARSIDGGKSWSKNTTLDADTCECCWNKIAIDEREHIMVLYRNRDPRDMAVVSSRDGGISWSKPQTVGQFNWKFQGCPHVGGGISISPNDVLATIWTGEKEYAGAYIFRRGSDATTSGGWQHLFKLPKTSWHTDICRGGNDDVTAVWDTAEGEIQAIKRSAAGWSEPMTLSAPDARADHPRVFWNGSNWLAVWTESYGAESRLRTKTY